MIQAPELEKTQLRVGSLSVGIPVADLDSQSLPSCKVGKELKWGCDPSTN